VSHAPSVEAGLLQSKVKVGMLTFLVTEAAFFSTLIMAYVIFLRQTQASDPSPKDVFYLPLVIASTLCLLSSSLTIHFADQALRRGARGAFLGLWGATIALGILFLAGTATEWRDLIFKYNLTISRNMFGTTYFTLVGFHAAHVTVGVLVMSVVLGLAWRRHIGPEQQVGVEVVSWYWHFVDGVWVVVFTLVYLVGR
jgi:cytochrome c oxidase subunit 3/cytochrome o ubiquinol oxidase subunit 3